MIVIAGFITALADVPTQSLPRAKAGAAIDADRFSVGRRPLRNSQ
jgi:hypothetical protein